ncbi:MAG: tripartite tricarboxylate transporter substrate binding protein [Betaproteobacteria bacterium]|jgi:hypothetical protein
MKLFPFFIRLAGIFFLPLGVSTAQTLSNYPNRPITIVVAYATGGSTDLVTRVLAASMSTHLGHQVIVDNRVGGGGLVGWSSVARSAPDGYTLLATELSFAIAPGLIKNLPFDARKSFQQVGMASTVAHVLAITPSLPVQNVKGLIALSKSHPGELNYGSGGAGTNTHLGVELFKNLAHVQIVHIPYRGAGAVLQDLMAGQVQMMISAIPTALTYVNAGRLRALMVTDEKRSPVLPLVPSANEAGLAQMKMNFWLSYAVPTGTAQAIVERLNQEIVLAVGHADIKKRLTEMGLEPVGGSIVQATQLVNDEINRWSAVIAAAGIKPL